MSSCDRAVFRLTAAALAVWPQAAAAAGPAKNKIESQTNLTSLQEVVERILTVLIFFLPAIATLYLALSGYRYIIAQGNPDLVEKAKKSLTYAVYGVLIAFASAALIALVGRVVGLSPL